MLEQSAQLELLSRTYTCQKVFTNKETMGVVRSELHEARYLNKFLEAHLALR